jgi:RNA polymerase sigma-70 factor, ECF subfamily
VRATDALSCGNYPQMTRASASTPLATDPPAGDGAEPDAFAQVYATNFAFVWRTLRVLGVPGAQLDDAAQEVFVVVHRRLAEFRGDASLRTWLYAVVRNVAANQRRGERRRGERVPLDEQRAALDRNPAEHAEDRELLAFVQRFAAQLDDKRRDVFALAFVEELPVPEVAVLLGIPLNTAYTRVRSVRIELQEALTVHTGVER